MSPCVDCGARALIHDARNLAGLLDTLSGKGYANALAANDE